MSRCVVEENVEVGVLSLGSDLEIDQSVVRSSLPIASGMAGMGIAFSSYQGERALGLVTQTVVYDHRQSGIDLQGSDATLEHVTIRDIAPTIEGSRGYGINAYHNGLPSSAIVRESLVERASNAGVISFGSALDMEATAIRDTARTIDAMGVATGGVLMTVTEDAAPTAVLRQCLIAGGSDVGAIVIGGDLTIEHSVVSDVSPSDAGEAGHGVHAQGLGSFAGHLSLNDVMLVRNHTHGVLISGADAILEGVTVADTLALNTRFGDGIAVVANEPGARATIHASGVRASERAGIASFGAIVDLADTMLDCNLIQLVSQDYLGHAAQFEDGGGNTCSCSDVTEPCKALSADLEVPTPIEAP
jgi:hypothetical protein